MSLQAPPAQEKDKKNGVFSDLIDQGEWIFRGRLRPCLVWKFVEKRQHVLPVLGEILWSVVEKGGYIVRRIHMIHIVLLEEVCLTPVSLLKVFLHALFNILLVDSDEVVPVGPHMLMDKTQHMKHFMGCCHQTVIKTTPVKTKGDNNLKTSYPSSYNVTCSMR